jgi:glycerate 2-kinase
LGLAGADYRIIASGPTALAAARAEAEQRVDYPVYVIDNAATGEAREVALTHTAFARRACSDIPSGPVLFVSGGELTVTIKGDGRGGPNSEYLLSLARAYLEAPERTDTLHAIACDTDGIDGSGDNAGAVLTPDLLARAAAQGLDAHAYLENNDAYGFFEALGGLVVTGPTGTNVNDFRALLLRSTVRT